MPQVLEKPALPVSPEALAESRLSAVQFKRLAERGIVSVHPNIVHGAVVFARTHVPIYNLWDYLSGSDSISDFLASFPTVARDQVGKAVNLR